MIPKPGLLLAALMPFLSCPAGADNLLDFKNWYLAPMFTYVDDDKDRDVDDEFAGYHLTFGTDLNATNSFELSAVMYFFNSDGFDVDQQQWGLGVDYIRRFGDREYFLPYAVVGGGYLKTQSENPGREDGGGAMASVGLGILTPLNLFDMKLRTELRLRKDFSARTHQDYLLSFGLQRAIRPKPVVSSDTDGDGVTDPQDRCGDTPQGVVVDRYGCARTRPDDRIGNQGKDQDGDGVPDDKDMCGDSLPDAGVDRFGCQRTNDARSGST